MKSRRDFLKILGLSGAGLVMPIAGNSTRAFPDYKRITSDPSPKLEKWTQEVARPGVVTPVKINSPVTYHGRSFNADVYEITAKNCTRQLHPKLEPTKLWGYDAFYPANTIEAKTGIPIQVSWINQLAPGSHPVGNAIDARLAFGGDSVKDKCSSVTHLHGGEVAHDSDGWPMNVVNSGERSDPYIYPNRQRPSTLWYHDHVMGMTRLNVLAGLAGFYLLRDPNEENLGLPKGEFEVPILIQDRIFDSNGQFVYPHNETYPDIIWEPEFFGDTILVNGSVWPYMTVKRTLYRFRILNGSNARFYNLMLKPGLPFYVIGTEAGFLPKKVPVTELLIAPGERYDVLVDFSSLKAGTDFIMTNNAAAPYPFGDPADPESTGQIMQFRISGETVSAPKAYSLPSFETAKFEELVNTPNTVVRTLTLNEIEGVDGPKAALVNHQRFMTGIMDMDIKKWIVPENPKYGDVEIWRVINMTMDAHPIHLHMVSFRLLDRTPYDTEKYQDEYFEYNPGIKPEDLPDITDTCWDRHLPDIEDCIWGNPKPPLPYEAGWKDTVIMYPGEITRIAVKFSASWAPNAGGAQDPLSEALLDPSYYPMTYVYHCHIVDHEDNDMMRPFQVQSSNLLNVKENVAADTIPASPVLLQNYPNPFNPVTQIPFKMHSAGRAELKIYNIDGQEVCSLADKIFNAGEHHIIWDGRTNSGSPVASGIYICRLTSGNFSQSIKMNLLR